MARRDQQLERADSSRLRVHLYARFWSEWLLHACAVMMVYTYGQCLKIGETSTRGHLDRSTFGDQIRDSLAACCRITLASPAQTGVAREVGAVQREAFTKQAFQSVAGQIPSARADDTFRNLAPARLE